jgi:hypothetical protein
MRFVSFQTLFRQFSDMTNIFTVQQEDSSEQHESTS